MEQYEAINAYVFVSDAHDQDLVRLRSLPRSDGPGVRAVGILNGPYDAIVAVVVDSLPDLSRIVMQDIRGGASPRTDTAIALRPFVNAAIPMSPNLPPVVAFVRAHLESGRGNEALDGAGGVTGFVGATLVAGSFDMLLEFGGESVDAVATVLRDELPRIGGIVSTVTSLAAEVIHGD